MIEGERMLIRHKDYLTFEMPNTWVIEEGNEATSIYDNNGEGALTLSFYTIMELQNTIEEHVTIMAKDFFNQNNIKLHHSFILDCTKKDKVVICGIGNTQDDWFIKIWVLGKYPRVVLATYESEKKTSEVKKVDSIINSFQFIL